MINPSIVKRVDYILDEYVAPIYKSQPLAQDWARVCKEGEEKGESIAELILMTGQNPRKGEHPEAYQKLLAELADRALTSVYAIQHFTKDITATQQAIYDAQWRHLSRLEKSIENEV